MTATTRRPDARRGAILLVVLVLLTLFAVVGLSFALYGESESSSARQHRETADDPGTADRSGGSGPAGVPDDIPQVVSHFLSQLVYDVPDFTPGGNNSQLRSSLRGHSLARSRYGYDSYRTTNGHLTAYSGTGPIQEQYNIAGGTGSVQRSQILNYGFLPPNASMPSTGTSPFEIIPERAGYRAGDPSAGYVANTPTAGMTAGTPPVGATALTAGAYVNKSAPYTSPDLNNAYLAVADPVTGQVIVPSYHRSWLFNGGMGGSTSLAVGQRLAPPPVDANGLNAGPTTNDWVPAGARLRIARPRPEDHRFNGSITFPYPPMNPDGTYTGDVQNLKWVNGVQKMDSLWMDVGAPTITHKGKTLQPLVAPLVLDLNSRVNLNASAPPALNASNILTHRSNMGLGPVETNPLRVMGYTGTNTSLPRNAVELNQMLSAGVPAMAATATTPATQAAPARNGATVAPPTAYGVRDRYRQPTAASPLVPSTVLTFNNGRLPPHYSRTDVDANTGLVSGGKLTMPAATSPSPFPTLPATGYETNATAQYPPAPERTNHPLLFNPLQWSLTRGATAPQPAMNNTDPHAFGPADVPLLFGRFSRAARSNKPTEVTGLSADPANPTVNSLTGFNGPNEWAGAAVPPPASNANPYMSANFARMALTTYSMTVSRPSVQARTLNGPGGVVEFVRLGPIDLNRVLPDLRKDTAQAFGYITGGTADNQLNADKSAAGADYAKYALGRQARQNLARDIFVRLVSQASYYAGDPAAMGTPQAEVLDGVNVYYVKDSTPVTTTVLGGGSMVRPGYIHVNADRFAATMPTDPLYQQLAAIRRCAQMAANLVDYIDSDDAMTPFVWNPFDPQFSDAQAVTALNAIVTPTVGQFVDPAADERNFWAGTMPEFPNRVVFGTELPKVVLNEVYAAVANDRADIQTPPTPMNALTQPYKVKFWLELTNPLNQANDPVLEENGAARLQVHQFNTTAAAAGYSPYLIEVVEQAAMLPMTGPQTFTQALAEDQTNVTGDPATVAAGGLWTVRARVSDYLDQTNGLRTLISEANGTPGVPSAAGMPLPDNHLIRPFNATAKANPNVGFFTLAGNDPYPGDRAPLPTMPMMPPPVDPNDVPTTARLPDPPAMAMGPVNSLTLSTGVNSIAALPGALRKYTVVLRRLADPHRPVNDPNIMSVPPYNPNLPPNVYVTVDMMDEIQANDRVTFDTNGPRPAGPATVNNPPYGKRHPFAAAANAVAFEGGGAPVPPPPAIPPHTFFDKNGNVPSNMTELTWMPHADRELISPAELLHASAVEPYMLTTKFGVPPVGGTTPATGTDALKTNQHTLAPLLTGAINRPSAAPPVGQKTRHPDDLLFRAFDVLSVRSRLPGVPVGGAEPGRVNLNTVWDTDPATENVATNGVGSRVLAAVLDPKEDPMNNDPTNPNTFNQQTVRDMWGSATVGMEKGILGFARTLRDPAATATTSDRWAGRTAAEWISGTDMGYTATPTYVSGDRPFWGSTTATPGVAGFESAPQTLFRLPAVPATGTPPPFVAADEVAPGPKPLLYNPTPQPNGVASSSPYLQSEPLRKMLNGVTTTSDSFLVLFTVGYFEVRGYDTYAGNPTNFPYSRPILGKEVYDRIPGDMRVQYATVVDRSMLTVEAMASAGPGSDKPAFTGLVSDAHVGDRTIDAQMAIQQTVEREPANPTSLLNVTTVGMYADGQVTPVVVRKVRQSDGSVVSITPMPPRLRVGFGDSTAMPVAVPQLVSDGGDGEWVTIDTSAAVFPTTVTNATSESVVRLTLLGTGLTRAHPAGSPLSNTILGNPGPQTGRFDPTQPQFRGLFPLSQPVPPALYVSPAVPPLPVAGQLPPPPPRPSQAVIRLDPKDQ